VQDRFPQYYKYFGVRSFTYKGTKYRNHNKLLGSVEGVDGIKTGYTRASGFNLVTSVRRGDRHLIAVVMGGKTGASRDAEMRKLLSRYLPSGKPGDRSPPMLVADSSEADIRLPRPRPGSETETALSYAPVAPSRDLVTAAMAQATVPEGSATEAGAEPIPDPVISRIDTATQVASLALESSAANDLAMARLTQIAQIRAGTRDMVATKGAGRASDPEPVEAGWHIQIGAVPTMEAAQALLDNARNSMGEVLKPRRPMTQEVDRDGTTLYRARFAGFSDKDQARATCAKLMSKSFSCLAVPN
jgi:D-alanyl-D-alanine carboxypeptidase